MQVETTLRVFTWIAKFKKVENRLDIGVETVITLASESNVTVTQFRDGLSCIAIKCCKGCDSFLRRVLAVVALIVEGCRVPLIVGWNHAGAEHCFAIRAMVYFRNCVSLRQVLPGVIHVLDDAEV